MNASQARSYDRLLADLDEVQREGCREPLRTLVDVISRDEFLAVIERWDKKRSKRRERKTSHHDQAE